MEQQRQIANQTGGTLFYKGASQSSWNTNGLTWLTNTAVNQYWQTSFTTTNIGADEVIQYYFLLTFDGSNGVSNTYLYGGDGFIPPPVRATAAASPFTVRNRPAWLFHDGNRVVTANANGTTSTVSFWTKSVTSPKTAAFAGRTTAAFITPPTARHRRVRWASGSGTTQVMPLIYDHEQDNPALPATPCGGSAR